MKRIGIFLVTAMFLLAMASPCFSGSDLTRGDQTIYGHKTFEHDVTFNADVTILGALLGVTQYSNIYYVDSDSGHDSAGNYGTTYSEPFATIDYAIGQCTADNGDIIFVMPGYTEDLAAADAIDADIAGVSIIGLGNGNLRPTLTYTADAGEFVIGADDVRVSNIIFVASDPDTVVAIDIEDDAEGAVIDHCSFITDDDGTAEFLDAITINDQCNEYLISHNQFHQGSGAAVSAIYIDADTDYGTIEYNTISGDYDTACITGDEQDDMIVIRHNSLYNGQATGIGLNTEPCIELNASTTGIIEYNICYTNLATKAASIVAADCHLHENYYNEDESGSGTSGIIGTASDDDG